MIARMSPAKTIVHYKDGRILKGFTRDFVPYREAFVRGLAAATGGESELVSPREGMADRVIRHFERMRAPRAKRVATPMLGSGQWPTAASR